MSLKDILHRLWGRAYVSPVPPRRPPRLEPIRYLKELNGYVGLWVAVKDGKVRASAQTSTRLAEILFRKNIEGATIQFVAPPSEREKVGLG